MVAPGLALPPTTLSNSRGGPIPRRGLYTLSPTKEQERAETRACYIEEQDIMVLNSTLDNERVGYLLHRTLTNAR